MLVRAIGLQHFINIHHFLFLESDDNQKTRRIGVDKVTRGIMPLHSFQTLRPEQWLDDIVINTYYHWARMECGRKTEYLPTYFVQILLTYKDTYDTVEYNFASARKQFSRRFDHKSFRHQKLGIFAEDIVLVPINIKDSHWVGIIISVKDKSIQYYDSMGGSDKLFVDGIYRYLTDEWASRKLPGDFGKWTRTYSSPETYPKQPNGFDCGVYVCALYDSFLPNKEGPPDGAEECFVRRNTVAARTLKHCLGKKTALQRDEEASMEQLRLFRKDDDSDSDVGHADLSRKRKKAPEAGKEDPKRAKRTGEGFEETQLSAITAAAENPQNKGGEDPGGDMVVDTSIGGPNEEQRERTIIPCINKGTGNTEGRKEDASHPKPAKTLEEKVAEADKVVVDERGNHSGLLVSNTEHLPPKGRPPRPPVATRAATLAARAQAVGTEASPLKLGLNLDGTIVVRLPYGPSP